MAYPGEKPLPKYDGTKVKSYFSVGGSPNFPDVFGCKVLEDGTTILSIKNGDVTAKYEILPENGGPGSELRMLCPDGFWAKASELMVMFRRLKEAEDAANNANQAHRDLHQTIMHEAGRLGVAMGMFKDEPYPDPEYWHELEVARGEAEKIWREQLDELIRNRERRSIARLEQAAKERVQKRKEG